MAAERIGVVGYVGRVVEWWGLDADADLGVSSSPMARKADGRLEVVATDKERAVIFVSLLLTTGLCAASAGGLGYLLTR